jgi:hypothetical protein
MNQGCRWFLIWESLGGDAPQRKQNLVYGPREFGTLAEFSNVMTCITVNYPTGAVLTLNSAIEQAQMRQNLRQSCCPAFCCRRDLGSKQFPGLRILLNCMWRFGVQRLANSSRVRSLGMSVHMRSICDLAHLLLCPRIFQHTLADASMCQYMVNMLEYVIIGVHMVACVSIHVIVC